MGKSKKAEQPRMPSPKEQRHWQAEDIVRRKLTQGPAYEKQVRKVEKEIAKIEKKVKV